MCHGSSHEDVDFEDGSLLVRCGKGKKIRIVPLGRAAGALAQYIAHARPRLAGDRSGNVLFLSREHGALSREALVRIVRGHTGVAPHRLRHACATNMLRSGAQSEKIQAVLGHSSSETTKTYLHGSSVLASAFRPPFGGSVAHRPHTANGSFRLGPVPGRRVRPARSSISAQVPLGSDSVDRRGVTRATDSVKLSGACR